MFLNKAWPGVLHRHSVPGGFPGRLRALVRLVKLLGGVTDLSGVEFLLAFLDVWICLSDFLDGL